jgi:hypothetical protein
MTNNSQWIAHVAKDFFSLWKARLNLNDKKDIKYIITSRFTGRVSPLFGHMKF